MRLVLILAVLASVCMMVYGQTVGSSSSSSSGTSGVGASPIMNLSRLYNMGGLGGGGGGGGGGGAGRSGGGFMRNMMLMGGSKYSFCLI